VGGSAAEAAPGGGGGTVAAVRIDLSRRHPLVVGTVAAVLALAAAVGAAAAWDLAVGDRGPARPEPDAELRFGPDDAEGSDNPLVADDVRGRAVPDDRWTTFDGEQRSFADYAGTPVVLNFFGSWCVPCIEEMPAFESVHQEVGDEVHFLGIAVRDSVADAQGIVDRTGVTYEVGRDAASRLTAAFGVVNMPSTFLISPEGRIVASHSGALDAGGLRRLIDEHLR
jgi:cytochrome c biogenesis protein CcmG, thiol:disulfide interchange protein DsbE